MIEARLSVFNRLLRLSGRLDIVLSQLSHHSISSQALLGKGPKVVSAGRRWRRSRFAAVCSFCVCVCVAEGCCVCLPGASVWCAACSLCLPLF
jgi:hypothetical protein